MTPIQQQPWWMQGLSKYGPVSAIAGFLVWWMASGISADLKGAREDIKKHMLESGYYMYQLCTIQASQAGVSQERCNYPRYDGK